MKISTRLANLETGRPEALSENDVRFLVELLAKRDAIFWPWRCGSVLSICEMHRRQREYLSGEIGISAKGSGKNQWKQAHEKRNRLIAAGYILGSYQGGQVQSVLLTSKGEAMGRALVGDRLITLADIRCHAICELLRRFGGLVRESQLFDRPCIGGPSEWEDWVEMVLPLLTAGIVQATSDGPGCVLFSLTEKPFPNEMQVISDTASNPDFDDAYVVAFDAERASLAKAQSRDSNEIFIRVPATLYWNKEAK